MKRKLRKERKRPKRRKNKNKKNKKPVLVNNYVELKEVSEK